MRLLAHEVAHTIQQSRGEVGSGPLSLNRRGGPWEIEADRAANDALAGELVHLARGLDAVRPLPVGRPVTIQCHESYEHRALGDVSTDDIYAIAASSVNRNEILKRETDLMWLWHQNPELGHQEANHRHIPLDPNNDFGQERSTRDLW